MQKDITEELHISNIIRHMRTTEGLLREKLQIDNERWDQAMQKFSSTKDKYISEAEKLLENRNETSINVTSLPNSNNNYENAEMNNTSNLNG